MPPLDTSMQTQSKNNLQYYILDALIGVTVSLTSIIIITITAIVVFIVRKHYWIRLKSRNATTARGSSGNPGPEYDEVFSDPPNISAIEHKNTYANVPAICNTEDVGGTGNSGYESLEMQPQNHQYESLATA